MRESNVHQAEPLQQYCASEDAYACKLLTSQVLPPSEET